MKMPPENVSSERLLESWGIYHLANISSDPDTAYLEANFSAVQNALSDAVTRRKECRKAVIIAMAKRDHWDVIVDWHIRKFNLELLAQLNNNKESSVYKKLFPDHLTGIINQPIVNQINNLKETLEPEMENLARGDDFYKKHLDSIKEARIKLEEAVKSLDNALISEGAAWAQEKRVQIDWRRQYEKNYGEIRAKFAGEKIRIESYFRKFSAKLADDETESAENA